MFQKELYSGGGPELFQYLLNVRTSFLLPEAHWIMRIPYMFYSRFLQQPIQNHLRNLPLREYTKGSFQLWPMGAKSKSILLIHHDRDANGYELFEETKAGRGPRLVTMQQLQTLRFILRTPEHVKSLRPRDEADMDQDPDARRNSRTGMPHVSWLGSREASVEDNRNRQ